MEYSAESEMLSTNMNGAIKAEPKRKRNSKELE